MSELTDDDFVFVEVTKTFMMTKQQARRMVSIARLVCADTRTFSRDDDGTEITHFGEDFLKDDGQHDYADAAGQLADPEGLLKVELVAISTLNLDAEMVTEISRFWPEDWRVEAYKRLHNLEDEESKKGD